MTLTEIEAYPKGFLTPAIVGAYLGADPALIRYMAKTDPDALGFPVVRIKNRTKIPKDGFVYFCKYGRKEVPTWQNDS